MNKKDSFPYLLFFTEFNRLLNKNINYNADWMLDYYQAFICSNFYNVEDWCKSFFKGYKKGVNNFWLK